MANAGPNTNGSQFLHRHDRVDVAMVDTDGAGRPRADVVIERIELAAGA